jgi:hypothetical protein
MSSLAGEKLGAWEACGDAGQGLQRDSMGGRQCDSGDACCGVERTGFP